MARKTRIQLIQEILACSKKYTEDELKDLSSHKLLCILEELQGNDTECDSDKDFSSRMGSKK